MARKNIKGTIKEHFFVSPSDKLRVREMEKALKLPLPSVIRYCRELRDEGFLRAMRTGNVVFYTADRASGTYVLEKRLFNIKSLYVSGLVGFLKEELSNPPVVVFGSYARGEDVEESDIDVYIETVSKKKISLEKFEKKLQRNIQVFRFKGIRDVMNRHLSNNIVNGVLLNGFVEVFV